MSKVVKVKASKRAKAHTRIDKRVSSVKAGAGRELSDKKSNDWDYDGNSQELSVTFPNGATYIYHAVPVSVARQMKTDPSAAMSKLRSKYVYSPDNHKANQSFNRAQKKRAAKK